MVLNLIINGLPSILFTGISSEMINGVLNLIINGLPSIPDLAGMVVKPVVKF